MRCRQVRKSIDTQPLNHTDGDQRLAILAHCESCVDCRRWLDAAALATSLIRARACEEMEPSPFFRTRVLAAIREHGSVALRRQTERMWRSSRAVVASMFAVVMILLALNLFAPQPPEQVAGGESFRGRDSVERIVMDDTGATDDSITSGQVLDTVFAQGDSYGID